MDNSAIKSAVTFELTAAEKEHNPIAELTELSVHLSFELNRVIKRLVDLKLVRDNDTPDEMTCCNECGGMMPTPERGGSYVCVDCLAFESERAFPNSDDDDERDAEDDDSDHIYDPYAFADGH